MPQLSANAQKLYEALLKQVESTGSVKINGEWVKFGVVYIDNVQIPDMTNQQKAGYYSALELAGYYVADDGVFGYVKPK